ncbi:MAG TPA: helix-turn-helix domain-containing protein [Candidatus Limnocylindrales bacterium]|nr:helix-turn-helix domain-containing protein [Candidatus Limnocylindrales bacterium]
MAARPSPTWLSLGPASRFVGVDPDTLRRWADDGRLKAYSTPGGHRRFAVADLQRVVATRRPGRPDLAALGATSDRLARAYARSYRADESAGSTVRARFGEAEREAFRAEGRRLVAVLLAYLDAPNPRDRDRWEAEAEAIVRGTAVRLEAAGADFREAIATFTAARRPFLTELAAIGRRRSLDVASLTATYDDAAALLDRLLLAFVDAFQPPKGAPAP